MAGLKDVTKRQDKLMKIKYPTTGLRNATPEDIAMLKAKYPEGVHRTHWRGKKLPYNGIFCAKKPSNALLSDLKPIN